MASCECCPYCRLVFVPNVAGPENFVQFHRLPEVETTKLSAAVRFLPLYPHTHANTRYTSTPRTYSHIRLLTFVQRPQCFYFHRVSAVSARLCLDWCVNPPMGLQYSVSFSNTAAFDILSWFGQHSAVSHRKLLRPSQPSHFLGSLRSGLCHLCSGL